MRVFLLLLIGLYPAVAADMDADSLIREAAALSSRGKLDAALALVEGADSLLPPAIAGFLRGRYESGGASARKGLEIAASDSNSDSLSRGEAIFLLGQFLYAAREFHFAIPRFREYLLRYPDGIRADAAAFWMGYACLAFARSRPEKSAYLDTGLVHATRLEARARSGASPPAPQGGLAPILSIKARLLSAKGDTGGVRIAVEEIRRIAPAEELSDVLASPGKRGASGRPAQAQPRDSVSSAPRYTLQLGAFSQSSNAEQLRARLSLKGVKARVEESASGDKKLFRVLYGDFADASSAQKGGESALAPLGYIFQVTSNGR